MASPPNRRDIFSDSAGRSRTLRGVTIYSGSTRLAEMAIRVGFDTAWIEMEHGPADFGQAEAMCMAIEAAGGIPTIRIPDGQRHHVLRALEVGAQIVVIPMINSEAQARQVVEYGKFPPLGRRGYNTRSRGMGYGLDGWEELSARANSQTHLFVQIETYEAVANLSEICAIEGLSGVFVGPGDLSISFGRGGNLKDPELISVVRNVVTQAHSAGKRAGILVGPGPMLDAAIGAGCDLIFCGGDMTNLATAWPALLSSMGSGRSTQVTP